VWLRTDNVEGGLGQSHPAVVISRDQFNDSHAWGVIVPGSSRVPADPEPEQLIVRRTRENGLDVDTVFLPVIQSARWERMTRKAGVLPPHQFKQLLSRVSGILKI